MTLIKAHPQATIVGYIMMTLWCVAGCGDPGFTLRGSVSDRERHPVEGADVVLNCYGNDHVQTKTDATGSFRNVSVGVFGKECVVRVSRGSAQDTFTVMDHCSRKFNETKCSEVTLDVTLP